MVLGRVRLHMGAMVNDAIQPQAGQKAAQRGFALAFSAYFLWGLLPFYMKWVAHLPLIEVVAHRIIWSVPLAGLVLVWLGRTSEVKAALRSPRMIAMATLTAVLITVNWGIYVWAIGAGRAIETALGYYINPLFSIFLGAVLLKEKPSPAQMVAIGLAACAVWLAIASWRLVRSEHRCLGAVSLVVLVAAVAGVWTVF